MQEGRIFHFHCCFVLPVAILEIAHHKLESTLHRLYENGRARRSARAFAADGVTRPLVRWQTQLGRSRSDRPTCFGDVLMALVIGGVSPSFFDWFSHSLGRRNSEGCKGLQKKGMT